MKKFFFVLCIFFGSFSSVSAAVGIHEIAWMGTAVSASDEWIELHNTGSEAVDLTGWTLTSNSLSITLSGSIPASGFFLLERTDDESVPNITANQIYSGSLSNTGDTLVLKDTKGSRIDTVNASDGWQAGDNTTKETMQRSGSSWITATATPKAKTVSNTPATPQKETKEDPVVSEKPKAVASMKIEANIPDRIVQGIDTRFSARVLGYYGEPMSYGVFSWNFGDGTFSELSKNDPVSHTYLYPGEYVVWFGYYSSAYDTDPKILYRKTITVVEPGLSISSITSDGSIEISNTSKHEVDISGFVLEKGLIRFVIPRNTIILEGSKLVFTPLVTKFTLDSLPVFLKNPSGKVVSEFTQKTSVPVQKTSSSRVVRSVSTEAEEVEPVLLAPLSQQANVVETSRFNSDLPMLGLAALVIIGSVSASLYYLRLKKQKTP